MAFLPVTFVAFILVMHWDAMEHIAIAEAESYTPRQAFIKYGSRFAQNFFPRSSSTFGDLDQAVATAAGATVLAFSIYGVAEAHFKTWHSPLLPIQHSMEMHRVGS